MEAETGAMSAVKEGAVWFFAAAGVFLGIVYLSEISALVAPNSMRPSVEASARPARPGIPAPAINPDEVPSEIPADEGASNAAVAETSNSADEGSDRSVHIQAQSNGHFVTEASINNHPVEVVVDTGATGVALTYEDAEAMGISISDADFTGVSQTANGESRIARVKLDEIRIGDVSVRDVDAFVAEPGKLFGTLLGMTFLSRLGHIEMSGNELVLSQ